MRTGEKRQAQGPRRLTRWRTSAASAFRRVFTGIDRMNRLEQMREEPAKPERRRRTGSRRSRREANVGGRDGDEHESEHENEQTGGVRSIDEERQDGKVNGRNVRGDWGLLEEGADRNGWTNGMCRVRDWEILGKQIWHGAMGMR